MKMDSPQAKTRKTETFFAVILEFLGFGFGNLALVLALALRL